MEATCRLLRKCVHLHEDTLWGLRDKTCNVVSREVCATPLVDLDGLPGRYTVALLCDFSHSQQDEMQHGSSNFVAVTGPRPRVPRTSPVIDPDAWLARSQWSGCTRLSK